METTRIEDLLEDVEQDVIGWRRHIHQNPELSFQETETAQFVYDTLQSFGGLEISRPTKTSVLARLIGTAPGGDSDAQPDRVLALRADMDALPIEEASDLDFVSSNPGIMHACGHDGHTAMLLGAAKVLSNIQDRIHGEIRFLFQHAEELFPGGAQQMVEAGVMEGVDAVIGAHLWADLEVGKVGIGYGPMMAAPDTFTITIEGSGGHAARPHKTTDSIAIGSQVVTNLQHVVSRNTDPIERLVVSVTKFVGGTADNVIPGTAELTGTVRSFDPELRRRTPEIMERVIRGITEAHGAKYQFDYRHGYRPVINDDGITRYMQQMISEVFGDNSLEIMRPVMGGEDFSAYQQQAPGTFVYVGAGSREQESYPHHHPRFHIDEEALGVGVKVYVNSALRLGF